MMNMIISGFGLVLFLTMFRQSYFLNGINRAYLGLYKGVVESAVIYFDENGKNITPYFDKKLFKDAVSDYLLKELKGYTITYSLKYTFKNTHSPSRLGFKYPNYASVKITLEDNPLVSFDKSASFVIRRNH